MLLSFLFSFFVFFPCAGHHRDRHSFPTRRSSDLAEGGAIGAREVSAGGAVRGMSGGDSRDDGGAARHASNGTSSGRSEEHTSELQSPCNLVCRLLLEKKKRKKQDTKK